MVDADVILAVAFCVLGEGVRDLVPEGRQVGLNLKFDVFCGLDKVVSDAVVGVDAAEYHAMDVWVLPDVRDCVLVVGVVVRFLLGEILNAAEVETYRLVALCGGVKVVNSCGWEEGWLMFVVQVGRRVLFVALVC